MALLNILAEFPSGHIATEMGPGGVYLRFDCDCDDAVPTCKARCCYLPGIYLTLGEVKHVRKAAKAAGITLPVIQPANPADTEKDETSTHEMIRTSNGACRCLDQETDRCLIYEDRPETCRVFHCTRGVDTRGWALSLVRQAE